jgi:hypothetical protein
MKKEANEVLEKNTFLKMAAIRSRNMEAHDVYIVTNSHIFISTFWFYSHNAVELIMKETFFMLPSQIVFLIPARYDGRRVLHGTTAAPCLKRISSIWILEIPGDGSSHLSV